MSESRKRPDYVTCVAHTHAHKKNESWCGRFVNTEFHFQNIDHAAYNAMNEGRLLVCPECHKKIIETLKSGVYE